MKQKQIEFKTILDDSFRAHEARMISYMSKSREKYVAFALWHDSHTKDEYFVFTRIAFAILSANTPFDDSVRALAYVYENRGAVRGIDLAQFKCVPAKADYVNALHDACVADYRQFLRAPREDWIEYRYRLQKTIKGLGIAKASFAVSLLYPLTADVACIDTWMQKVFLGNAGFKELGKKQYETVEARVRVYARMVGVSTFLAQWMIWDHARGGEPNAHAIFPGTHKEAL